MSNEERVQLLKEAQMHVREAISKIASAVELDKPKIQSPEGFYDNLTEAQDWVENYTLIWLGKVVDDHNELSDMGNIDSIIDWFAD
jgi:hypothetical protein